jgi:hypothetical protein
MSPWQRFWFLPLGAMAVLALAVWTTDPSLSALLGGVAGILAAGFLVLAVVDRVHFEGIPVPPADGDALVTLTRSFRGGRFGREEILSRLDGLDLALGQTTIRSPEEVEEILRKSESEFLEHVEARIRKVEALT